MKKINASVAILCAALSLAGCARDNGATTLLGTLEWDRIALPAEVSEPITQILVKEGDRVAAEQVLVQLDARRTQAQADAGQADVVDDVLPVERVKEVAEGLVFDDAGDVVLVR